MSTPNEIDEEIILTHGDYRLRTAPLGASLRGFWRETSGEVTPIVTGYSGKANKAGGQGDVLIPFPGRVKGGTYIFAGKTFTMPRNDKDGPNAIHGFLRLLPWTITEQSLNTVTFSIDYSSDTDAYPSAIRTTVTYTLDDSGFSCAFAITNIGTETAPVAAGFHPYFTVSDSLIDTDILYVPMESVLEFDSTLIPTGKVLPVAETALDFRIPNRIGDIKFNTCYANPIREDDGKVRIRLASGATDRVITVWMDESFDYVVLYSGDPLPENLRRRSLAIEPMTCASDGFNHAEWGLISLEPGKTFSGTWGVTT